MRSLWKIGLSFFLNTESMKGRQGQVTDSQLVAASSAIDLWARTLENSEQHNTEQSTFWFSLPPSQRYGLIIGTGINTKMSEEIIDRDQLLQAFSELGLNNVNDEVNTMKNSF